MSGTSTMVNCSSSQKISPDDNDYVLEDFQQSNIFYLPKLIHSVRSYGLISECDECAYRLIHAHRDVLIYEGDLHQNPTKTAAAARDRKEVYPEMLGVVERSWNFYYYFWYKTIDAPSINSSFQIYLSETVSNPVSILNDINERFHYWHQEHEPRSWKRVHEEISVPPQQHCNIDINNSLDGTGIEADTSVMDHKLNLKYSDQSNVIAFGARIKHGVAHSHETSLVTENPPSETMKFLASCKRKRSSSSAYSYASDQENDDGSLLVKTSKVCKHNASHALDHNDHSATSSSPSSQRMTVDQFEKNHAFYLQGPFIKSVLSKNRFEWNKSIAQCLGSDSPLLVDELSTHIARIAVKTALAEILERREKILEQVQAQVKKNVTDNCNHSQGQVNDDNFSTSNRKEDVVENDTMRVREHMRIVTALQETHNKQVAKTEEQVDKLEERRKYQVAALEEQVAALEEQVAKTEEQVDKLEERNKDQVAKLEDQVVKMEERHKEQIQKIQYEQERFTIELQKKHQHQLDKLREENDNEKIAHSRALSSYLTASCDALRMIKDQYSDKDS